MNKKELNEINSFVSQYYYDDFYKDTDNKDKKKKKYVIEFSFVIIPKYLLLATIGEVILYLIAKYRYYSPILFFLSWLLFINGILWLIVILFFGLFLYEFLQIKKLRSTSLYKYEEKKINKYL